MAGQNVDAPDAVCPVLVQDPAHFRRMTLGQAVIAAEQFRKAVTRAYDYDWSHARVTKRDEKAIRAWLDDLGKSLALIDQVGWRP
jgi:hypothetical protein